MEWFSASFRCLAGIFFATLFVYRGFGIAAGTHALYDVLVGWLASAELAAAAATCGQRGRHCASDPVLR